MIVKRPELVFDRVMQLWRKGDRSFPHMTQRLCMYVEWTRRRMCRIRDTAARIVPLHLNRSQRMLIGSMMLQSLAEQPIRIVGLKARKTGFTTCIQTFNVFVCAHFDNQSAELMAHRSKDTVKIFDIARLSMEDYPTPKKIGSQKIEWHATRSILTCQTAGASGAGAGGTPSSLHLSEVALCEPRFKRELYTATNAVPDNPFTIIVQESTARGRDSFWTLFDRAKNNPSNGYAAVFVPWFVDETLTMPGVVTELDEYEQWLIRYAADEYAIEIAMGAIIWRRNKIETIEGGLAIFMQEYPATPEEAVQGRKSLVLPHLRDCLIDKLPFNPETIEWSQCVGGIDYGYNDPTAILTAVYRDRVLTVFHVHHESGKISSEYAPDIWEGHTYYGDPSEVDGRESLLKACREMGKHVKILAAPRSKNPRSAGFVEAEWDMVNKMRIEERLQIWAPCADQVLREADTLAYNEQTGRPNDGRVEGCGHFDVLAGLRYLVMGVEQQSEAEVIVVPASKHSRRAGYRR